MIYTLSWLPSVTLLGVAMLFLVVTVFAVAAVLAAVLVALAILLAVAFAMVWASSSAVRAARQGWPRIAAAGEPVKAEAAEAPALVNPRLRRVS